MLYFLKISCRCGHSFWKIGITDDFDKRLSAIRRGFGPLTVQVVKTFFGDEELESEVHSNLSAYHLDCDGKEFFEDAPAIQEEIERIERLQFPENFSSQIERDPKNNSLAPSPPGEPPSRAYLPGR